MPHQLGRVVAAVDADHGVDTTAHMNESSQNPLVLFMPSGKRGRFAKGTPVIDAA